MRQNKASVPYTIRVNSRVRIGGALVLGAIIIGGAFYVRGKEESPVLGTIDVGKSTPRGEVALVDADNDGVSDWEESLRTLSLQKASTTAGEIAGASVDYNPTTVTERFAQDFFENYLETSASGVLTAENQEAFLTSSIATLAPDIADKLYTNADIVLGGSSSEDLRAYGNIIADITIQNSAGNTESELLIFQRAVEGQNPDDFAELTNIANAYNGMLTDTLKVAVPEALADEHLALINAYAAVASNVHAMATMNDDPLLALLRVKRYDTDVAALQSALSGIYHYLYLNNVRFGEGEPGAIFKLEIR